MRHLPCAKGQQMDAMDILGGLIGKQRKSGGLGSAIGGKILKDLLGGGSKPAPAPPRAPQQPQAPRPAHRSGPSRGAPSLEDLLRKADDHYTHQQSPPHSQSPPPRQSVPAPLPHRAEVDVFDDEAQLLIRAMVNAAKADGQIDQEEQESIIGRLGNLDDDQINFLRTEFSAKSDVREFAWSVPLGHEENVYTISLLAIELDANAEAQYLHELAHGLRMDPDVCNRIHDKLNAPRIFQRER
jgi:uncharacterized membrane protein YebE (DUF533 family)